MSKSTLTQMSMVVRDALNTYSHRTLFDNRRRCENLCVFYWEHMQTGDNREMGG